MDRKLEWEISEAVNGRYYEEIKRLRHELEQAGVSLATTEGRRRFREAILELNRSFYVVLPSAG
jgi:hypothetical protein